MIHITSTSVQLLRNERRSSYGYYIDLQLYKKQKEETQSCENLLPGQCTMCRGEYCNLYSGFVFKFYQYSEFRQVSRENEKKSSRCNWRVFTEYFWEKSKKAKISVSAGGQRIGFMSSFAINGRKHFTFIPQKWSLSQSSTYISKHS